MEFFTASEWRKRCGIRTGRGITRDKVKAADIKFVKDTYNIDANDDICDAICIGYAYTNGKSTTIVTEDGRPSAHYEHTVLVTKDGYEILTPRLEG